MSFFGFTKGISNFLGGGNDENQEIDYNSLPYDKLLLKASQINSETQKMKNKIDKFTSENNILKNSIINNSTNGTESKFGKVYNNMKNSYLKQKSQNFDLDDFKNYLYNQKLLYGISDEGNINLIKLQEISDDDWNNNKNEYLFRQNILERNLNEFYRNILMSKELNTKLKKKGDKQNNDKNGTNKNERNEKNEKKNNEVNKKNENNEIVTPKKEIKEEKSNMDEDYINDNENKDNLKTLSDMIKNQIKEDENDKEKAKEKIIKEEVKKEELKNEDKKEDVKKLELKTEEDKKESLKEENIKNEDVHKENKKKEEKKKSKKKSEKKKKGQTTDKKIKKKNELNNININVNTNDFKLGFPDKNKKEEKNVLESMDLLSD